MTAGSAAAAVFITCIALTTLAHAQENTFPSPVTDLHLARVNSLFKADGIGGGWATRDHRGRVELKGAFLSEREVDRAFSLAQTVVGVRWVSPVTPQQIKVKDWEDCFSRLFSREPCRPFIEPPPATVASDAAPGPVAQRYALVVGVGQFRNNIQPLQYANKDAYDFYSYLVLPTGGDFHRDNVILLRDQRATRDAILLALQTIRERAHEDDLVLLYFSSHGTPPDKFGGVHLVTYDSEVSPRERIWDTALTEVILRDFIQNVRAKRLIVLLDACYSNGAYNRITGFLPQGGKSLDTGADEGMGRSSRQMAERLLGAKDLVLDQGVPPVARRETPAGWGRVLVSASDSGERSWESDQYRNGVFTRFLIDGLVKQDGALEDAFAYAKSRVRTQVKLEKGADIEQNPQLTPSRRNWNMSLGRARTPEPGPPKESRP